MADSDRSSSAEKLRARRERHLRRPKPVRVAFVVAGVIVLLAGLAMVVLPGPAFVVIPIGLGLLALEFSWAERWLGTALDKADAAKRSAARRSPRQRLAGALGIVLVLTGVVVAAVLLL